MNIVFMGTPVYAVACLEALIKAGHTIQYVFSQPDKPKDRGQKIQMPPVKEYATAHGIEVFQPCSLRTGEDGEKSHTIIEGLKPDCIIVVAYGQILPKEMLDIPRYGCINVHASLLPRYRGASPINCCVMNGETESGVSVMYMSDGPVDTGDVIAQAKCEIPPDMTASALHDRLMAMGAELLMETLPQIEAGTAPRTPHDAAASCYAPMLTKQMCRIDWAKPAQEIYNQIRGLSESPTAFTFLGEKRLKVYFARVSGENLSADGIKPGTIIGAERFAVVCGDGGVLELMDIQAEGGKRMEREAFLNGRKLEEGSVLR